jgi:hypothetical protein
LPEQSCAPPASLYLWIAALLAGAGLLVVVALALLAAGRWRSGRGAGALLALALAGWSLWLRTQTQAIYDPLAVKNLWNPTYCYGLSPHAPPGAYEAVARMLAAQIAPYLRAALITTSITIAFVLVVVVVATFRWLRNRGQPRRRIRWSAERGRALSLILLAALILASIGAFAVFQVKAVQAQMALNAPCPSAMTDADIQRLRDAGVSLIPSIQDTPVTAEAARTAGRQGLGDQFPADATCVTPRLFFVDQSTRYEAPRFAIVWVVGWRTPATLGSSGVVVIPPTVQWTFVDAQSGQYDGAVFVSVVGG